MLARKHTQRTHKGQGQTEPNCHTRRERDHAHEMNHREHQMRDREPLHTSARARDSRLGPALGRELAVEDDGDALAADHGLLQKLRVQRRRRHDVERAAHMAACAANRTDTHARCPVRHTTRPLSPCRRERASTAGQQTAPRQQADAQGHETAERREHG